MHVTTYQFANLYSWYSWPNVILPFVGGYLMDSVFGIRIGTVIFAVFIILGQVTNQSLRQFCDKSAKFSPRWYGACTSVNVADQ